MGYLLVLRIAGVNFTPAYVEQIQRLPDILSIHRLGQQRIWICHDLSRNSQHPKIQSFIMFPVKLPGKCPVFGAHFKPTSSSTRIRLFSRARRRFDWFDWFDELGPVENQSRELQKPGATPKKWCLNLGSWADLNIYI